MKTNEELDREILEITEREQAAMGELHDSVIRTVLRSGRKAAVRNTRSQRTGRLWDLGVLGETADILDEDPDVLLGALRAASGFATDAAWQEKWAREGRDLRARALPAADAKREPVTKKPVKSLEEMQARKALDRKRIAFGGVVVKAGLAEWDHDVLLGVFSVFARHRHEAARVERWKAAGVAAAAKPAPAKRTGGKPRRRRRRIEIQYPAAIPPNLATELRALGLKFDRRTLIWRGFGGMPIARRLAKKAGGIVTPALKTRGKPRKKPARKNSGNRRVRLPGDANIKSEATNKERKS